MDTNTGTPPAQGTPTPRDGDSAAAAATEASRNATDGAARNGQSDDGDDLDKEEDPTRLREIIRDLRKGERRRNEGYNSLQTQHREATARLAALERQAQAGAPLEDRVKTLEASLTEKDQKIARLEKERMDERTDADIMAAARRLNAADPEDVVRLISRDDLTIDDEGHVSNAEAEVRALLKKKPHLVKASSGGGADGGSRGSSGKGDETDMNSILRRARNKG